jgi:excisionase family DNA binding protein
LFLNFSIFSIYEYKAGEIMSDEILTLKEVAQYLKLTEKTAYRLAAEGKLPGFKVGGSWRFKCEDINHWIEEQKQREQNK